MSRQLQEEWKEHLKDFHRCMEKVCDILHNFFKKVTEVFSKLFKTYIRIDKAIKVRKNNKNYVAVYTSKVRKDGFDFQRLILVNARSRC